MSVRDNILFGKIYNEQWYKEVISACALQNDIKVSKINQLRTAKLTDVVVLIEFWTKWRSNIDR